MQPEGYGSEYQMDEIVAKLFRIVWWVSAMIRTKMNVIRLLGQDIVHAGFVTGSVRRVVV